LAKKKIQLIQHPPYSSDLALTEYFLFLMLKRELVGFSMTPEEFKKQWEGVTIMLTEDDFAFERWLRHGQKCIRIGSGYVNKS
jgi:hypothetical protein